MPILQSMLAADHPSVMIRSSDTDVGRKSSRLNPLLGCLFAYLLLKPFYFGSSGTPQISDAVLTVAMILAFLTPAGLLNSVNRRVLSSALFFALYLAVINLTWSLWLADWQILLYAAFALFNFGLLATYMKAAAMSRSNCLKTIAYATSASTVLQAALSLVSASSTAARETLFFNNPNQLGYWALLSASIFLICTRHVQVRTYVQIVTLLCLAYMAALSLSKAAMISFALLLGVHLLRRPKLVIVAFAVAGGVLVFSSEPEIVDRVSARLEDIGGQLDDSASGRGYDRIANYPEYLLLGAGEGGFDRFPGVKFELHSTFGTILFSYGLVGCGLFLFFMRRVYQSGGGVQFTYLVPAFLYGLTHQGLRFSLIWLLFGVVAASASIASARSSNQTSVERKPSLIDRSLT